MTLPTNISTGLVTGQFIVGLPEVLNADKAAKGTVTFTASVPYLPDPTASPNPVTLLNTSIVAVLDSEGYLCAPDLQKPTIAGRHGVRLVATDDPDISVQGWTWNVSYNLSTTRGAALPVAAHSMFLPSGANVDLTTVIKVPSSPGIGTEQAEALAASAQAAAVEAATSAVLAAQAAQGKEPAVAAGTTAQIYRGDKTWVTANKALVGLGNVDNTADVDKPVSEAQQDALDGKSDTGHGHDAAAVTTGNFADARMPLRLGPAAASVADWNLAVTNGYYFSLSTALNVPPGGGNILGYTIATATAVTQWAWSYQSDVSTDTKTYRRDLNGSTWSAWARVRQTEAELDLRYAKASYVTPKDFGAVGNGTTDDFTAVQAWLDSPIKDKLLSDGVYRVTTGLTCNVAGASIVGRGGTIKADTAEMDVLTTTGVNTTISGLVIDGNTKARYLIYSTGAGTAIERNRVFGAYSATNSPRGIYTSTPGGVTIRNNHISNINGPGNATQGDSNGLTRGIVMHSLTTCTAPSICSGNIITDITGEEADAIAVLYSDTVVTTYLPGHTLIQGNHIRNSSRRYIKIQGSNVTVDSNWCSSAPGFAAVNPSAVIDVIQGKNIVISNNRVEEIGLSSPVSIAGASSERITDITIKGNYLSEGDNASPVVYISYADNVVIADNVLVGGNHYANGGTCDGLVVANNVCRGGVTANVAFSFTSSATGKVRLNTIPTGRAEGTSTNVVFALNA